MDFCSNIIWVNDKVIFHHSIVKDIDDNFWIPTQNYTSNLTKYIDGVDIDTFTDDAITKVSSENEILYNKSVSEILFEHNLQNLIIGKLNTFSNDPIHLNDIEPVLEDGPFWKKGDVNTIDRYGPDGLSKLIKIISSKAVNFQSGYLYHYAFIMLIGFSLLLTFLILN